MRRCGLGRAETSWLRNVWSRLLKLATRDGTVEATIDGRGGRKANRCGIHAMFTEQSRAPVPHRYNEPSLLLGLVGVDQIDDRCLGAAASGIFSVREAGPICFRTEQNLPRDARRRGIRASSSVASLINASSSLTTARSAPPSDPSKSWHPQLQHILDGSYQSSTIAVMGSGRNRHVCGRLRRAQ